MLLYCKIRFYLRQGAELGGEELPEACCGWQFRVKEAPKVMTGV